MLTKEEYLSIIEDFEGIFFEMEIVYNFQDIQKLKDLIKEHFELFGQLARENLELNKKCYILNDVLDTIEKDYKSVLNELDYYKHEYFSMCDLIENPQPYKFEELRKGMWVWDNNKKQCIECAPNKNVMGVKCVWYWYDYDFEGELSEDYIEFEERRFFPVTKALEY